VRLSIALLCTCVVGAAVAEENGKEERAKVTPVLAPDPAVRKILDSLGDCSSANLPPTKTMGAWNETTRLYRMQKTGPVGRDFCMKAVWAPERKRALYCGGNHGVPHRLNDCWEYDLPSNTWVMLFAPDPNRPQTDWEAWANPKSIEDKVPDVLGLSAEERAALYKGRPFWLFRPEERTWQPLKTEPPYPPKVGGAQAMEHVPGLNGAIFYTSNWFSQGMWLYDPKTNAWKNLKPNNGEDMYHGTNSPRSEAVMAWDAENKVLVAVSGTVTYYYDPARNTWTKAVDKPKESQDVPSGHDARTPIGYDPVGKAIVLYDPKTPGHIWTHSVADKKWTKNALKGPPGPTSRLIGYWDLARNVMVVDSRGKVWVCRYRRATKTESEK